MEKRNTRLNTLLRKQRIDSIRLRTDDDYLPALRTFFRVRERRLALG